MINLECCGVSCRVDDGHVGRRVTCPQCGKIMVITASQHQHAHNVAASRTAPRPSSSPHSVLKPVLAIGAAVILLSAVLYPAARLLENASLRATERVTQPADPDDPLERKQQQIFESAQQRAGDPTLAGMYRDINSRHFAGLLPTVGVTWEATLAEVDPLVGGDYKTEGMTNGHVIVLRENLKRDPAELRRTLCHEMVHLKLIAGGDNETHHGPLFQEELERVFREGCFEAILASDAEKALLKDWIDREGDRVKRQGAELDRTRADLNRESKTIDEAIDDLNARTSAANAQRSGWPSDDERLELRSRQAHVQARMHAFNAAVEDHNLASERFNREVERYGLMVVYPHGVDLPARRSTTGSH